MNRFLFVGVILAVCMVEAREAVTDDVLARDWMRQDADRIDVSGCFTNMVGHALESRMCTRVVDELERMAAPKAAAHRSALALLEQANKPANDPAWRAAYLAAAADRRAGRLAKLTAKTKQIIFTRHCLIAAPGNISSNQHPSDRRYYKKWKDP